MKTSIVGIIKYTLTKGGAMLVKVIFLLTFIKEMISFNSLIYEVLENTALAN